MADETPKPKTEAELLEARLTDLQNQRSAREETRRVAHLKKKIAAEELDAIAENIADRLAEDGAGERGVDFEVARANDQVFAFATPPALPWEKFQSKVSAMLVKDDVTHVEAHEYRNLARASLIERKGDGYDGLAGKADFDAACAKHPGLANRVYLILSDLAGGRVERRAGK